jgi:NAD(P) transhydrogenase subunit alpha
MGVGVAGLQAIATARRLGAVVTATDVRPATKEQVESLGAKFLAVEDEEFKQAQTAGGYAKEMSKEYQAKQAALTAEPHQEAGHRDHHRADPRPSGAEAGLGRDGEVDEARLRAGRSRGRARRQCRGREARRGGDDRRRQDRRPSNVPAGSRPRPPASTREPLLLHRDLIDKAEKKLAVNWDDELVKATALTKDGAVIHPNFQPKA